MGGTGSKAGADGGAAATDPIYDDTVPRFRNEMIKVVVVGPVGCGKTRLIRRLVHNAFRDTPTQTQRQALRHRPTSRVEISMQSVRRSNGDIVSLEYWDEATDSPIDVLPMFYADADAAVFIIDTSDQFALEQVPKYVTEITERFGISAITPPDAADGDGGAGGADAGKNRELLSVPVILVGTKSDDRPRVAMRSMRAACAKHGLLGPVHVSALRGDNCDEIPRLLAQWFGEKPKIYRTRKEEYEEGLRRAQEILDKDKNTKKKAGASNGGGADAKGADAKGADAKGADAKGVDAKKPTAAAGSSKAEGEAEAEPANQTNGNSTAADGGQAANQTSVEGATDGTAAEQTDGNTTAGGDDKVDAAPPATSKDPSAASVDGTRNSGPDGQNQQAANKGGDDDTRVENNDRDAVSSGKAEKSNDDSAVSLPLPPPPVVE